MIGSKRSANTEYASASGAYIPIPESRFSIPDWITSLTKIIDLKMVDIFWKSGFRYQFKFINKS